MALEKELETYYAQLEKLLAHEGRFVVIHGDEIEGIWQTFEDALKAGYKKFGLSPFMVKQILAVEPVHHYTHELPPQCPA